MDDIVELTAGPPVHGGHCLARLDGRVVFLRHAIPGERVRARLTETRRKGHWRADAIEVVAASEHRVPQVWPEAGPGGVGGGELGHIDLPGQLEFKRAVVDDALARIAGLPAEHPIRTGLHVQHPPGEDERGGLRYRTRIDLIADGAGRAGMYRYRSHEVLPVTQMPLAAAGIDLAELVATRWQPGARIEAVAPTVGEPLVLVDGEPRRGRRRVVREQVATAAGSWSYRVDAAGFWQVHTRAPQVLVTAVLAAADAAPGETAWDLYSGAGLLTLPLADAVGETGAVHAVEADPRAGRSARRNAHARDQIRLHESPTEAALTALPAADVVVLDPPRSGAGQAVMSHLTARRPRRIVYVACDPAALARDLAYAREGGYDVTALTGYDLFPHTHHVECVAVLEPGVPVASQEEVR
ncbi:class I SAM-dependent RNA methyltransferase [Ruania zhangjianzhongii]|uniref:class I SAM-dependent RNA methyltransferase n=1 Tax=Ruania zhangjianzhongii TaxID=2603206 RepID=UPI0011C925D2|nr:TRAM domain-containing protein [Ruania zhangjianzhongii]